MTSQYLTSQFLCSYYDAQIHVILVSMFANVDHGREQCLYLQIDDSVNCCVHFERYHNVFVVQNRIYPGFTGMCI